MIRTHLPATLLALILLLPGACASTSPPSALAADPPGVLLLSIDGLRAADIDAATTPHLARIAREGVQARWMTPSYPALTFPNHYTVVTGLRPDHHGVVHNTMRDPAIGGFRLSDRDAVGDARWWGGEPIWVGAEKAGLPTAIVFWPGSEAAVAGVRPTRWQAFDESLPLGQRVDRVVAWLGEPSATRPRFVGLYFETLDEAAHAAGPDSAEARAALATVDGAIGRLLQGLEASGRLDRIQLVVVSDHGMATVPPGQVIAVEDLVTPDEAVVVTVGQSIGIAPMPGYEARVALRLLGTHATHDCWRREALPARWHYGTHPRVPPIVCQMHEGWDALPRERAAQRASHGTRGSHGYDPDLPSMRAVFLARGPAFRRGVVLPPVDNVDVYPLLARLLGITPAAHDGDATALLPALRAEAADTAIAP